MDVSVLTVTWNSANFIVDQIESVKKTSTKLQIEHLVADNGSSDGTVMKIRQKFPELNFTAFDVNRGFGEANNELSKKAQGRYFLLLNPDMVLFPGSLDKMVEFMESNKAIGVLGCKLLNENGVVNKKVAPRRFPTFADQIVILTKLQKFFKDTVDKYLFKDFNFELNQPVDSVQGSCMLVRREIFEKRGYLFDPRYFIWFEDVDLCKEAKKMGFEVWYANIDGAVDFAGQSFKKQKLFWKQKEFSKSMIKYFEKWHPAVEWMTLAAVAPIVVFGAYLYDLLNDYEA